LLLSNPAKAKEKLGWEPCVSFEGLVQMMVDHDIELNRTPANAERYAA
jgi:GDPmannose 4,6-dehydratase